MLYSIFINNNETCQHNNVPSKELQIKLLRNLGTCHASAGSMLAYPGGGLSSLQDSPCWICGDQLTLHKVITYTTMTLAPTHAFAQACVHTQIKTHDYSLLNTS